MRDMQIKRPDVKNQQLKMTRQRLSRRLGLLVLVAIAGALSLIVSLMQPQPSTAQSTQVEEPPVGVFVSGVDGVLINDQRALPGMSIMPRDRVRTDASGRARLTFMENSTLQMAGNTQIRLLKVVEATQSRSRVLVLSID